MNAVIIYLLVTLPIVIIVNVYGIRQRTKIDKQAKLFARDTQEIIRIMEDKDMSYELAKETYLKYCYDHGIRTFCTYKPKK